LRSFYITVDVIFSIFVTGCTSVVTSVKPISLYEAKSNYKILDGIPYFLPKSNIHIDITWSESDLNWTVVLTFVIMPDPDENARFILRPNSNGLFDDNITITVDSNSLLQTVNTTITDKTVSSLADLVKAAGNVFTFGAAMPTPYQKRVMGTPEAGEQPKLEIVRRTFHGDFDPDVSVSISRRS
jgi:hypothetical protein